jgi:hypothetical protein
MVSSPGIWSNNRFFAQLNRIWHSERRYSLSSLFDAYSRGFFPVPLWGHLEKILQPIADEGRALSEGSREFLLNDPIAREIYLGHRFSM